MTWIIGIGLLILSGYLLEREIYFYEGTHLGPRLQAWLYDRWSRDYDEGKRASQLLDDEMLARPLLESLYDVPKPFILDFATGTGRLSYALLNLPDFRGHIVALDLSQGMLEKAAKKLDRASSPAVELLRHLSLPLPFPDAAFDAVCALEVLELFPDMKEPLRELTRVLRPGGILLSSRGTEQSGRSAKVKSAEQFAALLETNGLQRIQITEWWKLFDRVIATKRGSSEPVGCTKLSQVLQCRTCGTIDWIESSHQWGCRSCGMTRSLTPEGIVLN